MASFLTALEVGTSTVKVLIAEVREDDVLMIVGSGEQPSRGVNKGEIIDFSLALDSVQKALEKAEENAGFSVGDQLYLVASGGRVQSRMHLAGIPILNEEGEVGGDISAEDVEHALDVARKVPVQEERSRMHTLQQHFEVDGRGGIVNPQGMLAYELKAGMLLIHGRKSTVSNLKRLLDHIPIGCSDAAFSGFCSALAVLTADQKRAGALVIDLGGGTTDYVVYKGGLVKLAGSIAVGGDHVTADICSGLNINRRQAETLKHESGNAMINRLEGDQNLSIPAEGGFPGRIVRSSAVQAIVNARMEETFQLISDQIEECGLSGLLGAGVFLTGGGSALQGSVDLSRQVFNAPAQVGRIRECIGLSAGGGEARFASVVGGLHYAASQIANSDDEKGGIKAWLSRLWGGA
jgi:cell division protein FtsA